MKDLFRNALLTVGVAAFLFFIIDAPLGKNVVNPGPKVIAEVVYLIQFKDGATGFILEAGQLQAEFRTYTSDQSGLSPERLATLRLKDKILCQSSYIRGGLSGLRYKSSLYCGA